jgi:hypothetical protein
MTVDTGKSVARGKRAPVVRLTADRGYAAHRSRIPRSSSEFCTTTHLQHRSSQTQPVDDLC